MLCGNLNRNITYSFQYHNCPTTVVLSLKKRKTAEDTNLIQQPSSTSATTATEKDLFNKERETFIRVLISLVDRSPEDRIIKYSLKDSSRNRKTAHINY